MLEHSCSSASRSKSREFSYTEKRCHYVHLYFISVSKTLNNGHKADSPHRLNVPRYKMVANIRLPKQPFVWLIDECLLHV